MKPFTSIFALALLCALPLLLCARQSYTSTLPSQAITTSANPTSLLDVIVERGYLRVGTTGMYKPFSYKTNVTNATTGTSYVGADIDMALSLSAGLGLNATPEFVPTTFGNLTSDIATGKFDIAMSGISITLSRAMKVFFTQAVLRVGKAPAVRCADVPLYSGGLASIDKPDVRVATPSGGSNLAFDRTNLKQANITVYDDNNIIFQKLIDGAADVVITDVVEAELQAKLHSGVLCAVNPERPFNFEELGYLLPRDDVVWQEFVYLWLHIQLGSGAWDKTLARWLDYPWPAA